MLSGALRRIRVQATWRKVRWCYDSGFQARRVLRDDSSAVVLPGTTSVAAPIVCCCCCCSCSLKATFSISLPVASSTSFSSVISSAIPSSTLLSTSSSASSSFLGDYDHDDHDDDDIGDSDNDDESKRRFPRLCSDRRSRRRGVYRIFSGDAKQLKRRRRGVSA